MYPYSVVDLLPTPRMRSYQSGAEVPKLGFLFFSLFFFGYLELAQPWRLAYSAHSFGLRDIIFYQLFMLL